jgi:hypothetical protein
MTAREDPTILRSLFCLANSQTQGTERSIVLIIKNGTISQVSHPLRMAQPDCASEITWLTPKQIPFQCVALYLAKFTTLSLRIKITNNFLTMFVGSLLQKSKKNHNRRHPIPAGVPQRRMALLSVTRCAKIQPTYTSAFPNTPTVSVLLWLHAFLGRFLLWDAS